MKVKISGKQTTIFDMIGKYNEEAEKLKEEILRMRSLRDKIEDRIDLDLQNRKDISDLIIEEEGYTKKIKELEKKLNDIFKRMKK